MLDILTFRSNIVTIHLDICEKWGTFCTIHKWYSTGLHNLRKWAQNS